MKKDYNECSLLSLSETCKVLNIDCRILMKLINSGRIGCIRIEKRTKIPYSEIKRFVQESLFVNQSITNNMIVYGESSHTNIPEFDTSALFEKILEEHNNG